MQTRKEIEDRLLIKLKKSEYYFKSIEECLIEGIKTEYFIDDIEKGDGKELMGDKPKFFSISSSSALAINNFAFWLNDISLLTFLGEKNFNKISFERKFENGLISKFKPNVDISLENNNYIFAIESKFLEFLKKPPVVFSDQYVNINDDRKNSIWYEIMMKLRNGEIKYQHFDAAQLVKHYYGLALLKDTRHKKIIYLYWLPTDRNNYSKYISEINDFASKVKISTDVSFDFIEYEDLWQYWSNNNNNEKISKHLKNLRERYSL